VAAELNPLSYVVMALVGRGGAGAHDLVDMMRRGGKLHWAAAGSKLYAEPKRLTEMGYMTAQEEPGRTRPRTVYHLAPAGEEALHRWIAEPSGLPRVQSEAVVRLLAGDLGDDADLRASLLAMRTDIAHARALLDESAALAPTLPHRQRYLRLIDSLGRRVLDAHDAWLDEVEAELA
jgi:DNA-binding PadR family transcriptional regulator